VKVVSQVTGPRCLVVQSALADYRQHFLDEIERLAGGGVQFLTGEEHFDSTLRTGVSSPLVRVRARNVYIFGRRLSWQRHVVFPSIVAPQTVQEFNPRILSTWVTLAVRRFLKRPTVIWGHAWSRSGPASRSEPVRSAMRRLSDAVIVYTESQRAELAERSPRPPVYAAPNAIYSAESMRSQAGRADHVLWIGRMVRAKKPLLMVEGFARAVDQLPDGTRLTMVGDGPLRGDVELLARALGVEHRITFAGHVKDVERLAELFSCALVSVSTGYLGLSLTQSLSFGVPMLYARDEPHAPEIEAATADNSCTFSSDNVDDLAKRLASIFQHRGSWVSRRQDIVGNCRQRYSADVMARHFLSALAAAAPAVSENGERRGAR
jgi:glycosyltransferase involved in cell wall biosynthesis